MKVADLFALLSIKVDEGQLSRVDKALGTIVKQAKRAAMGFAAITTGAFLLVRQTANAADNFAKMSRKVGISVEKLQQLEFAAGISGTRLDVLRTGLQKLARTASDASYGLETAARPLKELGVNIKDGTGELRDLDSMLLDIADSFKKMPDGTKKTALAMELFGRAGAELIPLLNEGSSGIEKLRKEFESMGGQISTKDAKAFEEYNDTMLRVKTTLVGLRNQAVIALLPHIQAGSKALLEWVKVNKEMLKQKVVEGAKAFAKALIAVGKAVFFVMKHARQLLSLYIAWKTVTLALAGYQAFLAATATASGKAVMIAWLKALAPLILMVAVVVGIALLIEDIWVAINGGESVTGEFVKFLVDAFWRAVESIKGFFVEMFEYVAGKVGWVIDKIDAAGRLLTGEKKPRTKEQILEHFANDEMQQLILKEAPKSIAPSNKAVRQFSSAENQQKRAKEALDNFDFNAVRPGPTVNVTNNIQTTDPDRAAKRVGEETARQVRANR